MILVRDVFQAKYGRGNELVKLLKEAKEMLPHGRGMRILTDASGTFFTVVTEMEVESLAEWERQLAGEFAMPEFGEWFARMMTMVDSGRREFYHIE